MELYQKSNLKNVLSKGKEILYWVSEKGESSLKVK